MPEFTIKDMFQEKQPLRGVLKELLMDHTTEKNIVWATDTYAQYGAYYHKERQMFPDFNLNLILDGILLPRTQKTREQQKSRTKSKAEVFTPSWVCNKMNNFCDEEWFGRKDVFNTEHEESHTWTTTEGVIEFVPTKYKRKTEWQKYVDSRRIEITCGEAPFLVSPYDATTGQPIPIKDRIGIVDRKLRVVSENAATKDEWVKWATRAFEASYGFEYQGDNLLFARINMVNTFIDYYEERFKEHPSFNDVRGIATIVSWNVWQMDGLTDKVPYGIPKDGPVQESLFEDKHDDEVEYCKIKDWRSKKILQYKSLKEKEKS